MKCTATIVCPPPLAPGFRLTGIEVVEVTDATEVQAVLQSRLVGRKWGLVIVASSLMAQLPADFRTQLIDSRMPLFLDLPLDLPAPCEDHESYARNYTAALIRKAIGKNITGMA